MDLNNFSKALAPLARKEFTDVKISDQFIIKIVAMDVKSRQFTQRMKEFIRSNKIKDTESLLDSVYKSERTPETIDFVIDAIIQDWKFIDNDGKDHKYTEETARDFFTGYPEPKTDEESAHDRAVDSVFRSIVGTALNEKAFQDTWENYITKNS